VKSKGSELSKDDLAFLKPNFDRDRQMGPRAVGQLAWVGDGDKLKQRVNSQLEGDDV
jgi:hypothetical protein